MDVRDRNHVTVTGRADGPVVMLAHGFGCDQNLWRLVTPILERDFTVVLFDHVGSGNSNLSAWDPERYGSLDGYVDDVLELCRELALGPVTFVGHSVSAMMGVLAAVREPEAFAGLVLLAPSPCFVDDPDTGYRGGFSAADIEELLDSLDANYLGWSGAMAPSPPTRWPTRARRSSRRTWSSTSMRHPTRTTPCAWTSTTAPAGPSPRATTGCTRRPDWRAAHGC